MKTLLVYDSNGYILYQGSGDIREPNGIPFLWVDIPEDKRVISINTEVTPNVPIFEDIPKMDIQLLREHVADLEKDLKSRMEENEDINLMVLEAMASVYEAVLPFLPI